VIHVTETCEYNRYRAKWNRLAQLFFVLVEDLNSGAGWSQFKKLGPEKI
jgi:hypothetical protein